MVDKNFSNDDSGLLDNYEDEIDVKQSKLLDKSTQIQQLISHFEYRLLGFMWKGNAEKFYYTGKTLAGDESVQKIMLLLHPFSREVLLISNKQDFAWQKQLLRTRLDMVKLMTKATDMDAKDFGEVWRSFCNVLFNIGDIIVGKNARDLIDGYINGREEKPIPSGGNII